MPAPEEERVPHRVPPSRNCLAVSPVVLIGQAAGSLRAGGNRAASPVCRGLTVRHPVGGDRIESEERHKLADEHARQGLKLVENPQGHGRLTDDSDREQR